MHEDLEHSSGKDLIMIVDDNHNIVKLVQVNLEYEGYETVTAYDGEEALAKVKQFTPSLIILDVLMPKKTGWEVLEVLKNSSETASIPVIMLTAMGQKADLKHGWEGGVEDYITKPFNPMRLISSVKRILEKVKEKEQRQDLTTITPTELPVYPAGAKVAIIGGGERGVKILQSLLGNSAIIILGVSDPDQFAPAVKLAKEMHIFTTADPKDLLSISGLDLLIEATPDLIPSNIMDLKPPQVELLRGFALTFIWSLLEEKESGEEKVRALLKDLYVLYEANKAIGAQIDLTHTVDAIVENMVAAVSADGGAVFLEEENKFVVRASRNFPLTVYEAVPKEAIESFLPGGEMVKFFSSKENSLERFPWYNDFKDGSIVIVTLSAAHPPQFSKDNVEPNMGNYPSGFVVLHFTSRINLSSDEQTFLSTLAAHAGIAIENAVLYQSAREKQIMVEDLLSKVIDAQEEERKRIAGEIHDSVAQTLVSTLTKVQTCEAYCKTNPGKVPQELEELRKIVADVVKETRQILFNLRPSTLDDLGLIPTLENYFKKFEGETKIRTEFVVENFSIELSPHVETIVYRMVQEALANVKKHARAGNVRIILAIISGRLHLEVSDDGVGFEIDGLRKRLGKTDSMGLTSMKERVSYLGGALTVSSWSGHGTTLSVDIPVPSSSSKVGEF